MSRINIVSKRDVSQSPWTGQIVCIPVEGIPFYLSSLWLRSQKYWWIEDAEARGRHITNELGVHMLLGCGREITEAVNRVYTLLDGVYNGVNYTGERDEITGEIIYSPPLPLVAPNSALYAFPGIRNQLEDTHDMLNNAINGTVTTDYVNPRGTNPILEEILLALQAETNEESIELLQKILLALGGAI